jgi:hypothetical protein
MIDEKQKAVAPRSDGFDDKPLNSQCVRSILKRLSSVLKKHAEILAFYEAKNPRRLRVVGRSNKICSIHNIAMRTKKKRKQQ